MLRCFFDYDGRDDATCRTYARPVSHRTYDRGRLGHSNRVIVACIRDLGTVNSGSVFGSFWPLECREHELRCLYVAALFGRTNLARIQGVGQTITVIGASLGPLPLALSKDYFGSYDPMLVGVGAVPLFFAVIAVFCLRDPARPIPKDAT